MRTTLNLSETLIAELMKVSGVKTKTEALHLAISEFIRQKKLAKLRSLSGKLQLHRDHQAAESVGRILTVFEAINPHPVIGFLPVSACLL